MFDLNAWLGGLGAILTVAAVTWVVSLHKNDVSIVDGVWGAFFVVAAAAYAVLSAGSGPRTLLLLALVALWAVRLSVYIIWRNWGEEEDYRYREMRANNEPHFKWKSGYLVFGLQGVIAWTVSLSLLAGMAGSTPINVFDYLGILLWSTGMLFETAADIQLARFKADPANQGKVLDSGLWRYTRHPNYFGETCVWWGYYLIALAAGGVWAIVSPVIMTVMLLRVSGVPLLERDMDARRPGYRDYAERTNAFIPGPPKTV